MGLTPEEMYERVCANLPAKTGKTLEEWVAVVRGYGPSPHRANVDRLKSEHGIGHSTADIIVYEAEKPNDYVPPTDEELIARQYAGAKAALLPILRKLDCAIRSFGDDVELSARETYVSAVRGRQFAIIQPTTKTRLDLGLRLPGVPAGPRLQAAGSFGSGSITHRVALASEPDVDDELLAWLRQAYQAR